MVLKIMVAFVTFEKTDDKSDTRNLFLPDVPVKSGVQLNNSNTVKHAANQITKIH